MPTEEIIAGWDQNVEAGSYFKCDTLEELCEKLGLPVEQTVATVERYNELCDGGRDLDFFKKAKYMVRIDPPYYGAWNTLPQFFTVHGGPAHETPTCRCATRTTRQSPACTTWARWSATSSRTSTRSASRASPYGSCLTFGYLTGKYIAENE